MHRPGMGVLGKEGGPNIVGQLQASFRGEFAGQGKLIRPGNDPTLPLVPVGRHPEMFGILRPRRGGAPTHSRPGPSPRHGRPVRGTGDAGWRTPDPCVPGTAQTPRLHPPNCPWKCRRSRHERWPFRDHPHQGSRNANFLNCIADCTPATSLMSTPRGPPPLCSYVHPIMAPDPTASLCPEDMRSRYGFFPGPPCLGRGAICGHFPRCSTPTPPPAWCLGGHRESGEDATVTPDPRCQQCRTPARRGGPLAPCGPPHMDEASLRGEAFGVRRREERFGDGVLRYASGLSACVSAWSLPLLVVLPPRPRTWAAGPGSPAHCRRPPARPARG